MWSSNHGRGNLCCWMSENDSLVSPDRWIGHMGPDLREINANRKTFCHSSV